MRAVAMAYPVATLLRAKRVLPAAFLGAIFLRHQHDVRDRVADGAGDDADHAGCICTASPEMADHRDPTMRDDCIRRAGLGNVASVALEGGNRSILLRKADIGDG